MISQIIIIIVTIILTRIIISILGNQFYNIDEFNLEYSYYPFGELQDVPMTTKILLNIFVPNIAMLVMFEIGTKTGYELLVGLPFLVVLGYYLYRAFCNCVLLRRRQLYVLKYELAIAISGVAVALIVFYCFLSHVTTVFLTIDEIREAIWLAALMFLYHLVKQMINNNVKQYKVLPERKQEEYILKRYETFLRKFGDCVRDAANDSNQIPLLYAIMILEDFNRPWYVRLIENILVKFNGEKTVGIMQVKSTVSLTDKESIVKAALIIDELWKEQIEFGNFYNEEIKIPSIYSIALEYNPDYRYAQSVEYIYSVIEERRIELGVDQT